MREACPDVGIYYRNQPPREARERRVAVDNDFRLADNFAHAIDTGGATIMDARASLEIFTTCEAALESCRLARCVEVAT
jgi:predicted dehydrogenase